MSGEVKFGRVVERWEVGTTANVPIMRLAHATGPRWEPTGEVISAMNSIGDVEPGAFVSVVDLGKASHLVQFSVGPRK